MTEQNTPLILNEYRETAKSWPDYAVEPTNHTCEVYLEATEHCMNLVKEIISNTNSYDELKQNLLLLIKERDEFSMSAGSYINSDDFQKRFGEKWRKHFEL